MDYYGFTKQEKIKTGIRNLFPNVKNIGETYPEEVNGEGFICREFECSPSELLLTKEEYDLYLCHKYH